MKMMSLFPDYRKEFEKMSDEEMLVEWKKINETEQTRQCGKSMSKLRRLTDFMAVAKERNIQLPSS